MSQRESMRTNDKEGKKEKKRTQEMNTRENTMSLSIKAQI